MSNLDAIRRMFIAAAASTVLAVCTTGCMVSFGFHGFGHDVVEEDRLYQEAHIEGSGLDVRTENGGVTISRGGDDVSVLATIKARTEERLLATEVILERDSDGLLQIYPKWPDGKRKGSEGCSFEITVPSAYGVTVDTANGAIKIAELAGDANLETSNGRIEVHGHDGRVDADTSNGRVILVEITGDVVARTSNGRIEAEQIHGELDADTSNGAINAQLGDSEAGPVRLHTSNGAIRLEVGKAFEGQMTLRTSHGSINIPDAGGFVSKSSHVKSFGRSEATLQFNLDHPGERSKVTTSNGSITVKVADR